MTSSIKIQALLISLIMLTSHINISAQIPSNEGFDDNLYFGHEYGVSGIVSAILDVIKSDQYSTDASQELLIEVSRTLHSLWNFRVKYDGIRYPSWEKYYIDHDPSVKTRVIYPGQKYGPAGILSTLLELYHLTDDNLWLSRVEDGYWLLASQAINDTTQPHWPYLYALPKPNAGTAMTDLKYGSAGILDLNLKLYQTTGNSSYLDHAHKIVDWLENISISVILDGINYNVIPSYYIIGSTLPHTLGYKSGLAGIAPVIYRFGKTVNSQAIVDWATSLVDFVAKSQLENGAWVIDSDTPFVSNGFNEGVAGILQGLLEFHQLAETDVYDSQIRSGIDYLYSQIIQNSTHFSFYTDEDNDQILNSLYHGNLGIMRVLSQLTDYLNFNQLNTLVEMYEWFFTQNTFLFEWEGKEMALTFHSPYQYVYVDLSYAEGLGGTVSELLRIQSNPNIASRINIDLSRLLNATLNSLLYFQHDTSLWNKDILFNHNWLDNLINPILIRETQEDPIRPFFGLATIALLGLLATLVIQNLMGKKKNS